MPDSPPPSPESLDEICDEFERRMQLGEQPRIEDYMHRLTSGDRSALLAELIGIEIEFRGPQQARLDEYLHRFPDDSRVIESAFDTILDSSLDATVAGQGDDNADPGDVPEETATIPPGESSAQAPMTWGDPSEKTTPEILNTAESSQWPGVPGYQILGELGRGGMGVVYKALHFKLNRIVALKMILAGSHAAKDELLRFQSEAEAVARLQHPGIVQIYDVGEHDGCAFLTLEYVDGGSLDQATQGEPQPTEHSARLLKVLAEAMAAAHEKGIVHRDLKPANVLLVKSEQQSDSAVDVALAKITDFGLAKQLETDSSQTKTGAIMGTPSYMAPEQASGKSDQIGPPTDVYALGAILYELLTGHAPFRAENSFDTIMMVLEQEPIPPRQFNPTVPIDLSTICLKCLEKKPARRYGSAQELADELGRFLAGEPIVARPISRFERGVRWCRRRPLVSSLSGVVALLILLFATIGPWVAWYQATLRGFAEEKQQEAIEAQSLAERREKQEKLARGQAEAAKKTAVTAEQQAVRDKQLAEKAQQRAESARKEAEAARSELAKEKTHADQMLYARTISLAYQEWLANGVSRAEDLLDSTPNQYRGWEWNYLKGLCHADIFTLRGHNSIPLRVAFGKDNKRLVSLGADRQIRIWDVKNGQSIKVIPSIGVAVSHDADLLALYPDNGSRKLQIVSTLGSTASVELKLQHRQQVPTGMAAFSRDKTRLAVCTRDRTVRIWDLAKNEELVRIQERNRPAAHDVCFSPDGQTIAWKDIGGYVNIYNATNGDLLHRFREDRGGTVPYPKVAFSPDSQRLVSSGYDGMVRVYDVGSGERLATLRGHSGFVLSVAFSPDGQRIASSAMDLTTRIWDADYYHQVLVLRGHTPGVSYGIYDVAFSHDGNLIASTSTDTTIKLWHTRHVAPEIVEAKPDSSAENQQPQFPSRRDPSLEFITLGGHTGAIESLSFSPDSQQLASASWDRTVKLFDTRTTREILTFDNHQEAVGAVVFSHDGSKIASGTGGSLTLATGKIYLWDPNTGNVLHELNGHQAPISRLAFTSDDKFLISASGNQLNRLKGELKVWDLESGTEVLSFPSIPLAVRAVAVHPDDRLVAVGGYFPSLQLRDLRTGETEQSLGAGLGFFSLDFSPDGKYLAAGASDRSIRIWNVETKEEVWRLRGHSAVIWSLKYNPDGNRLVSTGIDSTVRVWDTTTGQELLTMRGHDHECYAVAFSPDGKIVASSSYDGTVNLRGSEYETPHQDTEWPLLLADDFERDEVGDHWRSHGGDWSVEDGVLKGVLRTNSALPNFYAATITLDSHAMPAKAEVSCDFWTPDEIIFETKFHDYRGKNGVAALYIGKPNPLFNNNEKGAAVVANASGAFLPVNNTTRFVMEPDRKYRFRTVRIGDALTMFVDGKEILSGTVHGDVNLPVLHVQASFGKSGDTAYIDNLEVRCPESAKDEIAALTWTNQLVHKHKLHRIVTELIANDDSRSEAVKRIAKDYANTQKEDPDKTIEIAWDRLTNLKDGPQTPFLLEITKRASAANPNGLYAKRAYAMALYRERRYLDALEILDQIDDHYEQTIGTSVPVLHLIRAMALHQLGKTDQAGKSYERHREMVRADHLHAHEVLHPEARELLGPFPELKPEAKEIEHIKQITFDARNAGWVHHDFEAATSLWADDFVRIESRQETPDQHTFEIPRDRMLTRSRLWFEGAAAVSTKFTRNSVEIAKDGDRAVVDADYTLYNRWGFWRFNSRAELSKSSAGWKIHRERTWLTSSKAENSYRPVTKESLAEADRQAEAAEAKGDPVKMMTAYGLAARHQDALGAARMATEQSPDDATLWAQRAERAYFAGDPTDMEQSAKKALELDPNIFRLPFIRALAARSRMGEPQDFGANIRLSVPSHFKEASKVGHRIPGKVLGAWAPTPTSSVVLMLGDDLDEDDTVEKIRGEMHKAFPRVGARILQDRDIEVGGYKGFSMVVNGQGDGKEIGLAGVETSHRMVLLFREDDLVAMRLASPTSEFDMLNSEFQVVLKQLEMSKASSE